ncbi:MAG: GNAT family N-acetyltransferase [Spartobacteria bacterium]
MNRVKAFVVQTPLPLQRKIDMNLGALHLRPLSWVRFTWDLAHLPANESPLPAHYQINRATAEDAVELRKVFSSSFMLDPVWSPAIGDVMQKVQSWLDHAFDSDHTACLALRHGSRIIGAALLSLDPKIDNHLAPGPTVSIEYRNRGFGTSLLERSLNLLREAGLPRASGIARDISPAAKFLYPKFGGAATPVDVAALLAA